MWAARLTLQRDEHIRALTAAVTATAQTVNDRDEHIRALTAKLQEREAEIAAIAKRAGELAKQNSLLSAAMTSQSTLIPAKCQRKERTRARRLLPNVAPW